MPAGHLAYLILGLLGELDLGAIERAVQAKDPRGERPCSPEMMKSLFRAKHLEALSGLFVQVVKACQSDQRGL